MNNLVECGVDTTVVFSHSALHSKGCLKKKKREREFIKPLEPLFNSLLSVIISPTYPANQQTPWRSPGCRGPGPAEWRCGWPPCRCVVLGLPATAPAVHTDSWTGRGLSGTAALWRSDRRWCDSRPRPPLLLQSCCHPSTDWWSAPSGGECVGRGRGGSLVTMTFLLAWFIKAGIRWYLEEIVDVRQDVWSDGNFWCHES